MTYLRMCWRYYLDEKPITGDLEDIAFAMRTDEKTVRLLLRFYFTEAEDGWRHKRIDKELAAYARKSESARKSANARWKDANAMRTHSERNANASKIDANQEPRTKNQELINTDDKSSSCFPDEKHHEKVNGCPYQKIVSLYHQKLPMLPKIKILSDARKRSIKARWINELPDLETWGQYFTDAAKSPFLMGRVDPGRGRRAFLADIDFLIRPSTVVKMSEGKYHRK